MRGSAWKRHAVFSIICLERHKDITQGPQLQPIETEVPRNFGPARAESFRLCAQRVCHMFTILVKFIIQNQQHRCYQFDHSWCTSDFNGLANPNPKNHRLYGKYTEKCFGEHMLFEPSITVDLTANRRFLLRRLEAIRDYVRPSFKRHKSGIVLLVLDGGRSLCFFDCQVKGTKSLTQTRPPQQLAGSCNSNLNLYKVK